MWPDRVPNPGPLTYESGAHRLGYAARLRVLSSLKLFGCVCSETYHSSSFIIHYYSHSSISRSRNSSQTTDISKQIFWSQNIYFDISVVEDPGVETAGNMSQYYFDIRGYFEISGSETSSADCMNSLTTEKQTTKISSANFRKKFSPAVRHIENSKSRGIKVLIVNYCCQQRIILCDCVDAGCLSFRCEQILLDTFSS